MANIKVDSELMLHMMAAEPITSTKRFTSVRDTENRPLLFSIDSEGHFIAIKHNGSGSNVQINLGEILGFRGTVDAFVVTQSSNAEGTLFIALATKADEKNSRLHVLKPMKPSDLDLSDDELKSKLLYPLQEEENARISQLHMNPAIDNTYPLLVPVYHDINGDLQIARISVTSTNWTWNKDLIIPQVAKTFIALKPGNIAFGSGLFVLYRGIKQEPSLLFVTTDDEDGSTYVDLKFPAGAEPTTMSTYTDEEGLTGLFIAGNGLFLFTPDKVSSGNVAERVSSDPVYNDSENLFIAQAGASISAWFETEDQSLGYQRATNDGKLIGAPTLLLPAGSNAEFAPIIDPTSTSQVLVILDDQNQLSLLEQSADTQVWTHTPFLIERKEKMTEISAFVTHIEVTDAEKSPLLNTAFILTSSAWVSVLVNGAVRAITTKGTSVRTDARGVITLVVPSQDLSCYSFTLKDVAGRPYLPPSGIVINPASKVSQRLSTIRSAGDLKNFKTGNGEDLLAGSGASEDDIKNAAGALSSLTSIEFSNGSSAANFASSATNDWHGPATKLAPVLHGSNAKSIGKTIGSIVSDVKNALWASWEWVSRQVKKATDWLISKVNGAWNFIVTIAGKAWSFVINSVNAVVKAAGFIFDKLNIAFHKVIDAFGFIFNWRDIKATKDSIKVMVTSLFDFGSAFMLNNKPTVAKFFENIEALAKEGPYINLPEDVKNKKQSAKDIQEGQPENSDAATSAPANVGVYHFEQAKKNNAEIQTASGKIQDAFDRILKPVLEDLSKRSTDLILGVTKLLSKRDFSAGEMLEVLGGGLLGIVIGLMKNIVLGLMEFTSDILLAIKAILEWNVHIEVLTPLLGKLDIPGFLLFDAVSLILAIHVTVLAKTITGKAPARIQSFDFSAMVAGKLDKETLLAYSDLGSYLGISYAIIDTIVQSVKITASSVVEPPKPISYSSVLMTIVKLAISFPFDKESPGREWRIAVWSLLGLNEVIKVIALKTGLPVTKLLAGVDIFMALSTFVLRQVVHGLEYADNKTAVAHARTSLSLTKSIYTAVGGVAGAYGTIVPDPVQKAGSLIVVAVANASVATISTGDKLIEKSEKSQKE